MIGLSCYLVSFYLQCFLDLEQLQKMVKLRIGFNIALFIIIFGYFVNCNPHVNHPMINNYLSVGDPVRVQISILNGSQILLTQNFPLLYSLEQPQIGKSITVPVHHNMDNLTIVASLWGQQSISPLTNTVKNLTRYAKIRPTNDFSFSMELEGVPSEKSQSNSSFGLHIPVRYSILLLYTEDPAPYVRDYLNFFNFKVTTKNNKKLFVPALDLSQLQVPMKTYKHINSIENQTHSIMFNVRVYSFRYYQFFFGFTNKQLLQQANPYFAQIYTDDMIDMVKETLFENNFYLVLLYFTLSFTQVFMQIFAFKSQIEVWRNIQTKPGLSIQVLYQRLAIEVIICLYLFQKDSNKLYLGFQLFDLILTIWKITKAIQISISRSNRFFISIGYKPWYNNKIESADSKAMHYTNYLILILFVPFMVYKIYPLAHKAYYHYESTQLFLFPTIRSVYSFFLESAVFFILIFGFVMMTPQLYINYKLKSVDHLPWRTLIYRFIYTIIDDIFVFMIDLPWLQRMFSFRDDIIFILYLVQRRVYRVDKNRLALSTGSIDLSTTIPKKQHIKAE